MGPEPSWCRAVAKRAGRDRNPTGAVPARSLLGASARSTQPLHRLDAGGLRRYRPPKRLTPLKERETMADTAQSILESEIPALLKTKPELAKEINAVIHFNITGEQGGTWTLDLTKDSDWVQSGAQGTPKMTIVVSEQDFIKIRRKQLNAQMAAMQGKLKFKPMDMGLAMKLGKLLS